MKSKFKKIIIGLFCISSLANAENPPKYEGYGNIYKEFEIFNKFQDYSNIYREKSGQVRGYVDNLQNISQKSKEYLAQKWSPRKWIKNGRLSGALNSKENQMGGMASNFQGFSNSMASNSGIPLTNVFLVHITSKIIVPPAKKLIDKAIKEVENQVGKVVERAVGKAEDFETKMINKVYDRLGITKLEQKINRVVDKVKETDEKINKYILTGTDKIGEFKQDLKTLSDAGYSIHDMITDDQGNLLVRIGTIYVKAKDVIKTLNKYAKNSAVEKGLQKADFVEGIVNDWDMIFENKLRTAINRSSYELGYLLAEEVGEKVPALAHASYFTGKVGKKFVQSGIPIGESTPEITRPFSRYNPDKVFLENNTLGFSNDESDPSKKEYKTDKKWHQETKEIFVDNFKSAFTGKPKDSTEGNVVGYSRPKIARDSVQKTAYTNAPFFFDEKDNEKNVAIIKALPRVQVEAQLRQQLEATKIATVLKGANLIETGEATIGQRVKVKGMTDTNGAYSALVFKPPRKIWIEYYGNSKGKFETVGQTDAILMSNKLQNIYLKAEETYSKVAKEGIEVLQTVYDQQMFAEGTTQLIGMEKDETKAGRTPNSEISTKADIKSVKDVINAGNSYLLAEDNHDYINTNQDKRKEKFKQRAEIEKIANAVKNEHNAFRDWQNAFYNNKLFDEVLEVAYGNFKYEFFKDEMKTNPEKFKNMTREEIINKNQLFKANFKGDKESLLFAKRSVDTLIKRRFMAIEQLNRNLGNQGARFKTVLDAVEFVKKDLENSDMDDPKNQERIALNLKRIYQAMAVITSQTREEISLISKNVINNVRTNELERLVLDIVDEQLEKDEAEKVVKNANLPLNQMVDKEVQEAMKTKNISEFLTKKYK